MIKEAIAKVVNREDLTISEAEGVMGEIMEGRATPSQIAALLTGLRMKGEKIAELAGSARAMRAHAIKIPSPKRKPLIDTCGTGGDERGTFNISTIVAFVLAGAGLAVAKHGNRSVSSHCGSADVLENLGVKIELEPELIAQCIDEIGIGFLFAPQLHPAMKYAMPSRREMGIRTIFNLLGPLTNPASASIQLMGVYRAELTEVMAQVLLELGTEKALIVYGADGLDELSTTGVNKLTELNSGKITTYYLDPRELGIARPELAQLGGGSPSENARIVRAVLGGERGPKRQIVELNAAAGLKVAGAVADFNQGLSLSAEVIDSGRAQEKLAQLIQFSQSHHNAQSG